MSEIDTRSTAEAVCPHCGYKFRDSYELVHELEGSFDTECPECEKPLHGRQNVTITYTTEK
jgi:DNA-directed RNA polymerase subunit RPC12/RpoP